jgi:nitroreductase
MEIANRTNFPLSKIIAERRSIRAFDSKIPEKDLVLSLFEAARWAPSSSNNQPWRYIYATKNEKEKYEKILSCLAESNQIWASKAPMLILSLTKKLTNTGKAYKHNFYDTGAANMALALQATSLGMQAHIMGGFDIDMAKEMFKIDESLEPVVVIAVGFAGNVNDLPENLRLREIPSDRFQLNNLFIS